MTEVKRMTEQEYKEHLKSIGLPENEIEIALANMAKNRYVYDYIENRKKNEKRKRKE